MFDVERLLGQMLGGSAIGRAASSAGSGLGAINGGLGGGLSKGALGIGALGVAWAAFEHFQESKKANADALPPPPPGAPAGMAMPPPPPPAAFSAPAATPPALTSDSSREADAAHLIRAMIAAANADGRIDAEERSRVLERALTAGLSPQTQQFLLAQLNAPAALVEIVAQTPAHLQRETYGASLMAITADTPEEQQYLAELARGLNLSTEDVQRIESALTQ